MFLFLQRLYQCGESESGALTSLFSAIPVVQSWAASFRASSPSAGGHDVDAGPAGRTRVAVTAIHSVEDKMWSPMWGLKGVLDLTVDVKSQAVTAARGMQRYVLWGLECLLFEATND
jgi:DNA replication ATP-dependent helicase Dna2